MKKKGLIVSAYYSHEINFGIPNYLHSFNH